MTSQEPAVSPSKVLRVLVVDDERGFRRLLQWQLAKSGIYVETAENGREGVHRAAQTPFDVIITDVTMPEMDGLNLLAEIKRTAPKTKVIVATGFGAVETAVHAMKKGASDFILKPYNLKHLLACVRQAMEPLEKCPACGRTNHEQ